MRPLRYMIRKEFLQIFRTKEMVAIIFIAPLMQMLILGFAITSEVKNITLAIADLDQSAVSKEITDAFGNTDRFNIISRETDMEKIAAEIHAWNVQMAVIIPRNFNRDLRRNLKPDLQIIVDGLDGNTAGVAMAYAQGIIGNVTGQLMLTSPAAARMPQPHLVEMQDRMWYNLDLKSAQYMVPGIVVVLLTIITMMLSSVNLVREREIGTLEQLMVTPLKKHELLLGKLIPFLILAFIELFIVLFAAQFIFSIEMQGSYLLLSSAAFLYLFTTLGLGIFISTITNSQQQAFFVSWFFMVLLLMMSGLFIPIDNMPDILQKMTYLNPMRYFMDTIRDIFQKGASLQYLLIDIIPMTIFGLLIFSFSVLKFQKRVS